MDGFEWDPQKESRNLKEHRLDFETASRIWDGPVFERTDSRRDYGGVRIVAFGQVEGRLMVVVYTWRGESRRIISARKANSREKRRYEEDFRQRSPSPQN